MEILLVDAACFDQLSGQELAEANIVVVLRTYEQPNVVKNTQYGSLHIKQIRANTPKPYDVLQHHRQMASEHAAWLDVVKEMRAAGVGEIEPGEPNERLHDAVVRWGEELAELRRLDPDPTHAPNALNQRRDKYNEHPILGEV